MTLTVTGDGRDIAIIHAALSALLGHLEDREQELVELRDTGDGSLAAAAAPYRLEELGRLQDRVAEFALDLPQVPDDQWPPLLLDLKDG